MSVIRQEICGMHPAHQISQANFSLNPINRGFSMLPAKNGLFFIVFKGELKFVFDQSAGFTGSVDRTKNTYNKTDCMDAQFATN